MKNSLCVIGEHAGADVAESLSAEYFVHITYVRLAVLWWRLACATPDHFILRCTWAQRYIAEAANRNIVSGNADSTFRPDDPVNKAEALKILLLINGINTERPDSPPYPDVSPKEWFAPFICAQWRHPAHQHERENTRHRCRYPRTRRALCHPRQTTE